MTIKQTRLQKRGCESGLPHDRLGRRSPVARHRSRHVPGQRIHQPAVGGGEGFPGGFGDGLGGDEAAAGDIFAGLA